MRHGKGLLVVGVVVVVSSCADAGPPITPFNGPWTPVEGIATELELTCRADGTMALSADQVQARPDGVHLRVMNGYDEPVSVGGFDADPGSSTWTVGAAPGPFPLSCWPFSQHGSVGEPDQVEVEVLDPSGMYVGGEVRCPEAMSMVGDFAEAPTDDGPPPLDVARRMIEGLEDDDVLAVAGYPKEENASVIVVRDGEVIASLGFARFDDRRWSVAGGTVCSDTGLRPFGR